MKTPKQLNLDAPSQIDEFWRGQFPKAACRVASGKRRVKLPCMQLTWKQMVWMGAFHRTLAYIQIKATDIVKTIEELTENY